MMTKFILSVYSSLLRIPKIRVFMGLIAVLVFVVYSTLPILSGDLQISPDETANQFFANTFADMRSLWYVDTLNLDAFDRLHPRSMESNGGLVVPSGFWGISVLYGWVGSLLSTQLMSYLTAFIAVLSSLAFFVLVKMVMGKRIAFISWFLLLVHPALWYYVERSWHHNVLFVSLLIFSAFFFVVRPFSRVFRIRELSLLFDGLFGAAFLFGAVFVRPISFIWLAPIFLLLIWWYQHRLPRFFIGASIVGLVLGLVFVLIIENSVLAGSGISGVQSQVTGSDSNVFGKLFPNGWDIRKVFRSFIYYYLLLPWWYTIPLLVGWFVALRLIIKRRASLRWRLVGRVQKVLHKRRAISARALWLEQTRQRSLFEHPERAVPVLWFVIYSGVTLVLVAWYGSWDIRDNPDPSQITLANSYIRYWLPSFVLSIPFVARGWVIILNIIGKRFCKDVLPISLGFAVIVVGLSYNLVFNGEDGVLGIKKQLIVNQEIRSEVFENTPDNAIIITDRHDKLFFGERRILFPVFDAGTFETMRVLKDDYPFYVYGLRFTDKELVDYIEIVKDLELMPNEIISFGSEALYELGRITKE